MKPTVFKLFLLTIFSLLISSCANTPPTHEELIKADYGFPISQDNAEKHAIQFLENYLKDPQSAIYKWQPIIKGYMKDAPILGGEVHYGYVLNASVNAKNSYGGYTGFKRFTFIFFNGAISDSYAESSGVSYMSKIY